MALRFIKETTLSGIADAIRSKTGATGAISVANMATEISSIATGGGGGSDGTGIEWESVMPATDITFAAGEYITFENVYPLILGATYKVKWGDKEYMSVAERTTFQEMDCIAIGNLNYLNGKLPDENPFVIGYIPSANGFGIILIDTSSWGSILREDITHSVAIEKAVSFGAVIQPLEITENGLYTALNGVDGFSPITVNIDTGGSSGGLSGDFIVTSETIIPETTFTTAYSENVNNYSGSCGSFSLSDKNGELYRVTFDGEKYILPCCRWSGKFGQNSVTFTGVGQSRIQRNYWTGHDQPESNVPFWIPGGTIFTTKTTGTHTIKIEHLTITSA